MTDISLSKQQKLDKARRILAETTDIPYFEELCGNVTDKVCGNFADKVCDSLFLCFL